VNALAVIARRIDRLNEAIGRHVAWLALAMVLVQLAVVVMRYVFGVSSIFMQESIVYMHGLLFMLAAGYTLLHDGHVRVDIFYAGAAPRTKALVDLIGVVLLLVPVCAVILLYSWPYVRAAWSILEGSRETSGIPAVYLLKTAILVFTILLLLQGLSLALHSLLVIAGRQTIHAEETREGV
jgi:TRAP-type mannitol/chloroaromatic compound transport system permease small subunit